MTTLSTATPPEQKTSDDAEVSALRVVELPFEDLTDEFVARWAQLESRSVEGNAFLSPHFVIPAVEHLEGAYNQKPLILAVESEDG